MEYQKPWRFLTIDDVRSLDSNINWPRKRKINRNKFFLFLSQLEESVKEGLCLSAKQLLDERRAVIEQEGQRRLQEKRAERMEVHRNDLDTKLSFVPSEDNFLQDVGDEYRNGLLAKFIDATSTSKLCQGVCCCCASSFEKCNLQLVNLKNLSNSSLLQPTASHPAHVLTAGMLLQKEGVFDKDGEMHGMFCANCLKEVSNCRIPKFSLANNMWVGDIPFQLEVLTVPERLLISMYYPVVYVYKLFSKRTSGPSNIRQWKLRGNVSTYRLAPHRMADLATGRLFPRHPEVLASQVSVTLIGRNKVPERSLAGLLELRRDRILAALLWLKSNNPFYYDIIIDEDALEAIPISGVPQSITETINVIEDPASVAHESGTYVPAEDIDSDEDSVEGVYEVVSNDSQSEVGEITTDNIEPDIIPVTVSESAVVDCNGVDLNPEELMNHGLRNTLDEPEYRYQHGTKFVNEYARYDEAGLQFEGTTTDPNHLLGAFPYLFPYGVGGFETSRKRHVSYSEHVKWALQFYDGRFAKNTTFVSQVFNVLQKREVCRAAELQVSRYNLNKFERLFKQVTSKDLHVASEEEQKGLPVSNPKVRELKKLIVATRRNVRGTDENRQRLRSRIFGMIVMKGPPSLWITLNFADMKEPIVQIFAGVDIDLDNFDAEAGPTKEQLSQTATANPYAATKAFFFLMKLFFDIILGIQITSWSHLKREIGLFGMTEAYMGTIEAQGRGTLHTHLLLWLTGAPTSNRMQELLKDVEFRRRMENFIGNNIHSHVEGLDDNYVKTEKTSQVNRLRKIATAYSRPLDPRDANFAEKVSQFEFASARIHHLHKCQANVCLVKKNGVWKCKRRAPWKFSNETIVHEDGEWESKRTLVWLNTWCLFLMLAFRCNHDIKLLTNAGVTKDVAWYTTKYSSKPQGKSYNMSTLLAPRYSFNSHQMSIAESLRQANRRMLSQCVNTIGRYQEFSGQQLIALLMGWGDRFESHTFVSVHLRSFMQSLCEAFPELKNGTRFSMDNKEQNIRLETNATDEDNSDKVDMVLLQASSSGLLPKSQVSDYMNRGARLESFCFMDFLLESYEPKTKTSKDGEGARHERVQYLQDLDVYKGRLRIMRHVKAEIIPDFLGSWPPRDNDPSCKDLYSATMLALFKPWRTWTDLKFGFDDWELAFADFLVNTKQRIRNIIQNVQFYYDSIDTASSNRRKEAESKDDHVATYNFQDVIDEETDEDSSDRMKQGVTNDPEESEYELDVEDVMKKSVRRRDQIFGDKAVDIGLASGILHCKDQPGSCSSERATHEITERISEWRKAVKNITQHAADEHVDCDVTIGEDDIWPEQVQETVEVDPDVYMEINESGIEDSIQIVLNNLNEDQRRACDIVNRHLKMHLQGTNEQLLMLMMGAGGVGKSVVINSIEEIFKIRKCLPLLAKTATTGVAASHINGTTIHWWAGLPIFTPPSNGTLPPSSQQAISKRRTNIEPVRYLIIDEISMFTLPNLGLLSKYVADIQDSVGSERGQHFGGKLNVILVGDFHQFPPPGSNKHVMFRQSPPEDNIWAQIGYNVFQGFNTVVILKQQMRAIDLIWADILKRVRHSETDYEDIKVLESLTLTNETCDLPDFNENPWNKATLVTSRHIVRDAWNKAMIKKVTSNAKKTILASRAEQFIGKTKDELTFAEKIASAKHEQNWKLCYDVEMFEGMRALITFNIAVKAHLANGTIGTVEKIILDPREPDIPDGTQYHVLEFLPVLLLFRPDVGNDLEIEGLPKGLLPIEPMKVTANLTLKNGKKRTITRKQFAITPAYAFTDYKSQAQTLSPVIIDIASPPSGRLSSFNAYVALSRSKTREHTRILREFDLKLFTQPMDSDLKQMDIVLDVLDKECRERYENKNHHDT